MRTASHWQDYEILDTGDGEKLERWQTARLVRPDPQIIWRTPRSPQWAAADAAYLRSREGGGHWEFRKKLPESWVIQYKGLSFRIRPTGFKHTGLFPEQAVNWDFLQSVIRSASRPVKVLNLFAYTGGATLACAAAGASVCHVDAAKGMVSWARDNAALSGLENAPIRWIVDDCKKFVERELRRGNSYDVILMDPPSYGRGPGGEVWKLEEQVFDLVQLCAGALSDTPLLFLLNSYTTGLSPSVMSYVLETTVGRRFPGSAAADELGLPVTSSGLPLPCGSTAVYAFRPETLAAFRAGQALPGQTPERE